MRFLVPLPPLPLPPPSALSIRTIHAIGANTVRGVLARGVNSDNGLKGRHRGGVLLPAPKVRPSVSEPSEVEVCDNASICNSWSDRLEVQRV